MNHYKVFLRGENFLLALEGKPARLGFFTTRFVRAETSQAAELAAVDLLRKDEALSGVQNRRDDPPMIFAEEIARVYASSARRQIGGFSFFPMKSARTQRRRPTCR